MTNSTSNRAAGSNSLQLAHQWWATLEPADRQRVWDARHSYLASDLVERHCQLDGLTDLRGTAGPVRVFSAAVVRRRLGLFR
jgi:hypothetical protein